MIVKTRFTSLGPPGMATTSWVTVLSRYPFSDSMLLTIPLTRRTRPSSTKESMRIATFSSLSFSSIFVVSSCLLPVYSMTLIRCRSSMLYLTSLPTTPFENT